MIELGRVNAELHGQTIEALRALNNSMQALSGTLNIVMARIVQLEQRVDELEGGKDTTCKH